MHCISAIFENSIHVLAQYLTKMKSQDISAKGAAKSLIKLSSEKTVVVAEVDNNIVLNSKNERKYEKIEHLSPKGRASRKANEMNIRNSSTDAKTKNAIVSKTNRKRDKEQLQQLKLDSSELKTRVLEFEKGKATILELENRVLELDVDSNKKRKEMV